MDPNMVPTTPYIHYTAAMFVGVTVPFLIIALVAVAARFHPKVRPAWRFGIDDGFIILGTMLAVVIWAMLLSTIAYCSGKCPDAITINFLYTLVKISTTTIPIWAFAVATIKLSAIFMLLRFQQGKRWRIFLYIMAFIQVAYAFGNLIWLLGFFCRPFSAAYSQNPADAAKCVPAAKTRLASNICTYINIATDIILSLVPLTFLVKLNRPLNERIMICILMGTALLASAASIGKMMQIRAWNAAKAGDAQIGMSSLMAMWTCLELFLGITAACLPCLKAWFQSILVRAGLLSSVPGAAPVPSLRHITVTEPGSDEADEKHESNVRELSCNSEDRSGSNTTSTSYPEKSPV